MYCFFTEIMINAENLMLAKAVDQLVIELACAFQVGDRALTVDGQTPGVNAEATGALSPGTYIGFGCNSANTVDQITGYIRQIRYVPRRKTNAEIQTETT